MSRRTPKPRYLRPRQKTAAPTLGPIVAEMDSDLSQYYFGRDRYVSRALRPDDPATVFIGPKGVGKSAILQMVRLDRENAADLGRVITVSPDDLTFPTVAALETEAPWIRAEKRQQWLFTELWSFVLLYQVLRREFHNRQGVSGFFKSLFRAKKEDRQVQKLIELGEQAGSQKLGSAVLGMISHIRVGGVELGIREASATATNNEYSVLSLVNSVANEIKRRELSHTYYILIDDLDLHWTNDLLQNEFLGGLLLAIRKLSRSDHIKLLASLRDYIFSQIPLEDKDKYRDAVVTVLWDRDDIEQMVAKRLSFHFTCDAKDVWTKVFPESAADKLWRHTTGMPRECIRLAYLAIENATRSGHSRIDENSLRDAIGQFASEKIEDLESTYRHHYPDLGRITGRFRGGPREFSIERIREIAFGIADSYESDRHAYSKLEWATGFFDEPALLAQILAEVGFLQVKENRKAPARTLPENEVDSITDACWFAVHPMYAPALALR